MSIFRDGRPCRNLASERGDTGAPPGHAPSVRPIAACGRVLGGASRPPVRHGSSSARESRACACDGVRLAGRSASRCLIAERRSVSGGQPRRQYRRAPVLISFPQLFPLPREAAVLGSLPVREPGAAVLHICGKSCGCTVNPAKGMYLWISACGQPPLFDR